MLEVDNELQDSPTTQEFFSMAHYLLITPDADRRICLSNALRKAGAVVSEAETIAQGIDFARKAKLDAFIIDTNAEETDSEHALNCLRREGLSNPVLLLTEKTEAAGVDRVKSKGGFVLNRSASPQSMLDTFAA